MNARIFQPSARLQPYINNFTIIESEEGMTNTILPDTGMVMAFCFRGKVSYRENGQVTALPSAAITGLRQSARLIQYDRDTATLLVIFNEAGAAAFLPSSPSGLFNHTVAIEDVMSCRDAAFLCEQLAEAADHEQRIALVENMLIASLNDYGEDTLVRAAMQTIKQTSGSIRIRELAHSLFLSQDPFEKRFRLATGTSPKHFAEIVRLRSLIKDAPAFKNLGSVAHAYGFFDQAHFIRRFKAFTGNAPKIFFRQARYW